MKMSVERKSSSICFFVFCAFSFLIFQGCQYSQSHFEVTGLTVEYLKNPIGFDDPLPRLSWKTMASGNNFRQTAYQLVVATSESKLNAEEEDSWNSGKVNSKQQFGVKYGGEPLQETTTYYWKVRIWNQDGDPSSWSQPAKFITGYFSSDQWKGQWIAHAADRTYPSRQLVHPIKHDLKTNPASVPPNQQNAPAIYMRKNQELEKKPVSALALVSGLGYYELYVNGKKIGDRVLEPALSDYGKRIYYNAFELKDMFQKGANSIGIILGNGFYNMATRDLFQMNRAYWKGYLKIKLDIVLTYEDGRREVIATDPGWKWSTGAITFNDIRGGETIDLGKSLGNWRQPGYDDASWKDVSVTQPPTQNLSFQGFAPMRYNDTLEARNIWEPEKETYVVDFGRNITGTVMMEVQGNPGDSIVFDFNEALLEDSTLNLSYSAGHSYGRFQKGILILDEEGQGTFRERFSYHGFRYVQISGLGYKPTPESIKALSIHTDLQQTGSFICSNEKINEYVKAATKTLLNSSHGIPGEEPTREKMGWTQDGQNTFKSYVHTFENSLPFYKKYLFDHVDAQEPNGHIPPIVPTSGWGLTQPDGSPHPWSDPWWGGTLLITAIDHFRYTADTTMLHKLYPGMKGFVEYLQSTAEDHILYWGLGDWNEADLVGRGGRPQRTPVAQTSTAGYFYLSKLLSETAGILGNKQDFRRYTILCQSIRKAFNRKFLDFETGLYADDSQTSQVLPLYCGIAPDSLRLLIHKRLIENIESRGRHISTGFVGVLPLMNYLLETGHQRLAYEMFTQLDSPGWLHLLSKGGGTVGENLNAQGYGTGHHPFGAHILGWMYEGIAGIQPDPEYPGMQSILLRPRFFSGLDWLKAKTETRIGTVALNWKRDGKKVILDLQIPGNATANLILDKTSAEKVIINGKKKQDVKIVEGVITYSLGSGKYSIQINSLNK